MQACATHPHQFGPEPIWQNIPNDIRGGQWCAWYATPKKRDANGNVIKYDKVPCNRYEINSKTQLPIGIGPRDQWLTFDQAYQLYTSNPGIFNGVGRVAGEGYTFVDVDSEKLRTYDQWATEYATYAELSPSGKGLRIVSKGTTSRDMAKPVEVYSGHGHRFLTITGDKINQHPIVDLSAHIEATLIPLAVDSVEALHTEMPEMILPPEGTAALIFSENCPDRSDEIMSIIQNQLHTGQTPGQVLGLLYYSPDIFNMAGEHWKGKELEYLWGRIDKSINYIASEKSKYELSVVPGHEAVTATPDQPSSSSLFMTANEGLNPTSLQPPEYILDGIIPRGDVGLMFGETGTYKTFIALSYALCVALNIPWMGRAVEHAGPVIYVCGEGTSGVWRRVKAWLDHHNAHLTEGERPVSMDDVQRSGFVVSRTPVDISNTAKDSVMTQLISHCNALSPYPALIIIDTLSTNSSASEDSNDEIAAVIRNLKTIATAYNCGVVLIHHTGRKEKGRSRGAYALEANTDFRIHIAKTADLRANMTMEYSRDGESGNTIALKFELFNVIGLVDHHGNAVKVPVTTPGDMISPIHVNDGKRVTLSRTAYDIYHSMLNAMHTPNIPGFDDATKFYLSIEGLRSQYTTYCSLSGRDTNRGTRFTSAVEKLVTEGRLRLAEAGVGEAYMFGPAFGANVAER